MRPELVSPFADILQEYVGEEELRATCALFDIDCPEDMRGDADYLALSRHLLIDELNEQRWRLLGSLLDTTERRAEQATVNTSFERRVYHEGLFARLAEIREEVLADVAPREVAVGPGQPFTARAELRSLIERAKGDVTVVDSYVGPRTLDCLRDVTGSIRLLVGTQNRATTSDFDRALRDFQEEGFTIDVRRHPELHDRYVAFDGRIWLVGGSLKDAGRKTMSIVECIDSAGLILADIEVKWAAGTPYEPQGD